MVEFHGWAVIKESFCEEDEDENLLGALILEIEGKIEKMSNFFNEIYNLKCLNGQYHLMFMINHNHRSEHVIDFFKWIAEIAVGSYGVLYVYDDEDIERGNANKFKVWVMKKGKVIESDDPFLSPYNPEVEEF